MGRAVEHPPIIQRFRPRGKRRARRVFLAAFLAAALLPLVPRLLAVGGPLPHSADAIYVFPGQVPERAQCGAALYRRGLAPLVVFTGGQIAPELAALGLPVDDAHLNARIAREHGVPETAEIILPAGSSTWEDALVLGAWMRASGHRTVVAVTSPTHSRRALYTLRLALGDEIADAIDVQPCGDIYGPLWWTRERSLVRVTLESLKFGFYVLRYFLPSLVGIQPAKAPHVPSAHGRLATALFFALRSWKSLRAHHG